jgi:hypothetical protein
MCMAREVGLKVVGTPRRTAQVEGTRGCPRAAGQFEQEVPTVAHGMRWVGLDAARVAGPLVVLDAGIGLGRGGGVADVDRDGA